MYFIFYHALITFCGGGGGGGGGRATVEEGQGCS